jgi:hypothetical protein
MKYWKKEIRRIVKFCTSWASEYNINYYIMFPPHDPDEPLGYVAADYMCEDEQPEDVMLTVCPDGRVLYGYHA